MVTIRRGNHVVTVTKGAFKQIYRQLGYTLDEPQDVPQRPEVSPGVVTHNEDENVPEDNLTSTDDDLAEKPLGQMNLDELRRYADSLGLRYGSATSRKELRNLIREYI